MDFFYNYSLLPDILFADASVNPENDLKYGAQNFGKNTNGYYFVPPHHKHDFKESLRLFPRTALSIPTAHNFTRD